MNRREFFKRSSLGAGALFFTPAIMAAAWTDAWQAERAVDFAIEYALQHGAQYADARVGTCEIKGQGQDFAPLSLLQTELLGMRICTEAGWRNVLIRDFSEKAIALNLQLALSNPYKDRPPSDCWVSAAFPAEKVLARRSSDPLIAAELNTAWLRYAHTAALPQGARQVLFCDILIEH